MPPFHHVLTNGHDQREAQETMTPLPLIHNLSPPLPLALNKQENPIPPLHPKHHTQKHNAKIQHPLPPRRDHHRLDGNDLPPHLPAQMQNATTYLNKLDKASTTP